MNDRLYERMMEIAREECRIRSLRTGVQEVPGGLPKAENKPMVKARWEIRKQAIFAAIRNGNTTAGKIRKALHAIGWVNQGLETLLVSGEIRVAQRGKNWCRYEITPKDGEQ